MLFMKKKYIIGKRANLGPPCNFWFLQSLQPVQEYSAIKIHPRNIAHVFGQKKQSSETLKAPQALLHLLS